MHANFRLPGGICSQTKVRRRMIDTQTPPLTYANVIENCQGKVFRGRNRRFSQAAVFARWEYWLEIGRLSSYTPELQTWKSHALLKKYDICKGRMRSCRKYFAWIIDSEIIKEPFGTGFILYLPMKPISLSEKILWIIYSIRLWVLISYPSRSPSLINRDIRTKYFIYVTHFGAMTSNEILTYSDFLCDKLKCRYRVYFLISFALIGAKCRPTRGRTLKTYI